ncbi:MAG: DUF3047 domain-containing protein [Candidatus Omnitrophica bacterium]|nr:DUF3047 domain-containing protein [Candidatus Omnitrophota bacterium]
MPTKKALFVLLVTIAISLVAIPLVYYNIFIFKRAAREVPAKYKVALVKWFPFSEDNSLKEWEEKIFKGKVVYRIEKDQSLSYVRATSERSASALYYKIKLDSKKREPVISWKWRVEKFPAKTRPENLETKDEDDFAARVYVIFPAKFFTKSKVLEYLWAEQLPVGLVGTSPYSKNIKLIVAESCPDKQNGWRTQERDIISDYLKVFGRKPEYDIGAVAFMTNTEHTGTSADAMYDEIELGHK